MVLIHAVESAEEAISKVSSDGYSLQYLTQQYRDNRQVVLAAVLNKYDALQFASDRLKKNKDFILQLLARCGSWVLEHTDSSLKDDLEFMLAVVRGCPEALAWASLRLRDDRLTVWQAILSNPPALQYASIRLRQDRDIVKKAVSSCMNDEGFGTLIRFASKELQSDREIAMLALQTQGEALQHLPDEFRSDKELATIALSSSSEAFRYVGDNLKDDPEFVLAAIQERSSNISYASRRLQEDTQFILSAINKLGPPCNDGSACYDLFEELPPIHRSNKEVMMAAVGCHGYILELASENLQDDKELVMKAIAQDGYYGTHLANASPRLQGDREVALAAMQKNVLNVFYASEELLANASPRLQGDREVALAAMQKNVLNVFYASEELRNDATFIGQYLVLCQERGAEKIEACFGERLMARVTQWKKNVGDKVGKRMNRDKGHSIEQVGKEWLKDTFENRWLLGQMDLAGNPMPSEVQSIVAFFAGFEKDYREARDTIQLAPVLQHFFAMKKSSRKKEVDICSCSCTQT